MWYGIEEGYLRLELGDGSVLVVAASWEEGCHVVVDPGVPAPEAKAPQYEQHWATGTRSLVAGPPGSAGERARFSVQMKIVVHKGVLNLRNWLPALSGPGGIEIAS